MTDDAPVLHAGVGGATKCKSCGATIIFALMASGKTSPFERDEMVDRAFAGFVALPPGSGDEYVNGTAPTKRPWREVLGVGIQLDGLPGYQLLAVAKAAHRKLILEAHPDAGGSHELAAELNTALAEAEQELTK